MIELLSKLRIVFPSNFLMNLQYMINCLVLRGENSLAERTLFGLTHTDHQVSLDVDHTVASLHSSTLA